MSPVKSKRKPRTRNWRCPFCRCAMTTYVIAAADVGDVIICPTCTDPLIVEPKGQLRLVTLKELLSFGAQVGTEIGRLQEILRSRR